MKILFLIQIISAIAMLPQDNPAGAVDPQQDGEIFHGAEDGQTAHPSRRRAVGVRDVGHPCARDQESARRHPGRHGYLDSTPQRQ